MPDEIPAAWRALHMRRSRACPQRSLGLDGAIHPGQIMLLDFTSSFEASAPQKGELKAL